MKKLRMLSVLLCVALLIPCLILTSAAEDSPYIGNTVIRCDYDAESGTMGGYRFTIDKTHTATVTPWSEGQNYCSKVEVTGPKGFSDFVFNSDSGFTISTAADSPTRYLSIRYMVKGVTEGIGTTVSEAIGTGNYYVFQKYTLTNDVWQTLTIDLNNAANWLKNKKPGSFSSGKDLHWDLPKPGNGYFVLDYLGFFPSAEAAGEYSARAEEVYRNLTDPTVSFRGVQCADSTEAGGKLRLIGLIDDLKFEAVGFDISVVSTVKNTSYTATCTKVYDSILEGTTPKTAEELGGKYIYTFTVKGIPTAITENITFTVTPYSMLGGRKAAGETKTFTYNPSANTLTDPAAAGN